MRRRLTALVGIVTLTTLGAVGLFPAGSALAKDGQEIYVVPVAGQPAGHGMTLHIDVFYARGGTPGPPPGHGGGGSVNCTDDNSQTGFAAPFGYASPVLLELNGATVPAGLSVDHPLSKAETSWNGAGAHLTLNSQGTETGPGEDGVSTIGWAHLVPKNVLAATWTWTDAAKNVVEADLFFNNIQPWADLGTCPKAPTGDFDVADIATHEMGHVLGLNHYSDSAGQATMYPSAPPDEVRKVTLTDGDVCALQVSLRLSPSC